MEHAEIRATCRAEEKEPRSTDANAALLGVGASKRWTEAKRARNTPSATQAPLGAKAR